MLPEKMPAEPVPATALPIMNARELGATPQINDPSSNKAMLLKNTHFGS
jgi:hypothetical protein